MGSLKSPRWLTLTLLAGCAPVVIGAAVVGGAMVATDRRTSGSQVDDEVIELKAKSRMGEAFPDGRASIQTTSYNRMAQSCSSARCRPRPTRRPSSRSSRASTTSSRSSTRCASGRPSTFNETSNDVLITTKVKASLVDAKDLLANSIKVVTHRNVVYLMGRVTEREATRAAEIARGVSGVAKVVKVFEILTEAELASSGARSPVKPTGAASAASAP